MWIKEVRRFVDDWMTKHRAEFRGASDGTVGQILVDLEDAQIELMLDGKKHQDEIDLIYKAMYSVIKLYSAEYIVTHNETAITPIDEITQKLKFADYALRGGVSNHE